MKEGMRVRKRGYLQRLREWMMEYAYLVTIAAVIAVMAAGAIYTRQLRAQQAQGVAAAAQAPEVQETAIPCASLAVTPMPTIAPFYGGIASGAAAGPVSGGVIRGYSAQELVFWETPGCWRVHRAVDLAARAGEEVLCVQGGVVTACTFSTLWGWRVAVEQEDGSTAVYAGLERCTAAQGQRMAGGQALGTLLAVIPCEQEMGAHLHMELYRDGKPQDPAQMLTRR